MYETLTAAQMRAIETEAIEAGSVTGLTLMERAGQGVVDAIRARWPDRAAAPGRALVLAGPGNNGGDGFVIARLLKTAGWQVDLFLFGSPEKLPPDATANAQRWSELGETHDLEPALERGLDVDAVDTREKTEPLTPLFFAIKRNDPKMLRFMLDHGADLNKRAGVANADGERLKPLGYAYNLAFDDTRIDRNEVIGILDSALTEQSATGGLTNDGS